MASGPLDESLQSGTSERLKVEFARIMHDTRETLRSPFIGVTILHTIDALQAAAGKRQLFLWNHSAIRGTSKGRYGLAIGEVVFFSLAFLGHTEYVAYWARTTTEANTPLPPPRPHHSYNPNQPTDDTYPAPATRRIGPERLPTERMQWHCYRQEQLSRTTLKVEREIIYYTSSVPNAALIPRLAWAIRTEPSNQSDVGTDHLGISVLCYDREISPCPQS
ncbi:hypothetical protein F4778DRAFT_731974 [Xylariomycetidae sp. FL2044]|nr:hypothetical protein F4778DRAFT_731974 [Xylariomycetidae sp. FL2044]